jgi:ribosomal protein L20
MQTQSKNLKEKFRELPMQRITEGSRESGTFEEEETEHLDRRSISIIQKHMSEVLR